MPRRLLPSLLFFVPVFGYLLYAYTYRRENGDASLSSFVANIFENTLFYLMIGMYAASFGFEQASVLQVAIVIWVVALSLEMILVRKWGHLFPRFLEWWRLQRLSSPQLLLDALFYGLQTYAFFAIGFVIFRILF